MPKIANAHHSRLVPSFKNLTKEMRLQFMRNRVTWYVEPTPEDIEQEIEVYDSFDEICEAAHKHSQALFTMHTTLINSDRNVVDYKEHFPDAETYLQAVVLFELTEDRERFIKNYLVLEKLRT